MVHQHEHENGFLIPIVRKAEKTGLAHHSDSLFIQKWFVNPKMKEDMVSRKFDGLFRVFIILKFNFFRRCVDQKIKLVRHSEVFICSQGSLIIT